MDRSFLTFYCHDESVQEEKKVLDFTNHPLRLKSLDSASVTQKSSGQIPPNEFYLEKLLFWILMTLSFRVEKVMKPLSYPWEAIY